MAAKRIRWGLKRDLGIDLGTVNTVVYARRSGITVWQPSLLAVNQKSGRIVALGKEAQAMLGRNPPDIAILRPMRSGAVADFETTRQLLQLLLHQALPANPLYRLRAVVCVSLGTTGVERRAVLQAVQQAGAAEAYLLEEPLAAALGAGLALEEPRGKLVLNIGGGTTEVAMLALGGIVEGVSLRSGGQDLTLAIRDYLRRVYRLEVGEAKAEELKRRGGYACNPPDEDLEVTGVNLASGLPQRRKVKPAELTEAMAATLDGILASLRLVFEKSPPELASDALKAPLTITGGGGLLNHLPLYLERNLGLETALVPEPLTCAAKGAGLVLSGPYRLTRLNLYR